MVPYERNRFFVGRDPFIEELRDTFQSNSRPGLPHHGRIALFGLGGIGKTQIALEFVYRSQTSYRRIYWISAMTQDSLLDGYQKIGKQANIPITTNSKPVEVAEQVLSWLKTIPTWLLVVDNLDDIDVLSTRNHDDPNIIHSLLPEPRPGQHTLITTRNPNADHIPAQAKEVQLFKEIDSVALLSSLSGIPILPGLEEEKVAQEIAKELGNLPLAISQAGAYIKQKSGGFAPYLEDYRRYRSRVNSWIPKGPRPYLHSVATTWIMSFNEIRKNNSTAAHLFQLLAFFNPDGILIEFLKSGAEGMDNDLKRLVLDDYEFKEALLSFETFSLIKWDRQSKSILIHRLVQAVVKDEMSHTTDLTTFRAMTVDICNQSFPQAWNNNNRGLCRLYINQVMGPLVDPDTSETVKSAAVMDRVGWFLRDDGKLVDSERLHVRSRDICIMILGAEHPNTLTSMNNLALTYRDQGKTGEAAALQEEAAALRALREGGSESSRSNKKIEGMRKGLQLMQ
jgi:Tetratricopeptide repeat/NB-ARC domain